LTISADFFAMGPVRARGNPVCRPKNAPVSRKGPMGASRRGSCAAGIRKLRTHYAEAISRAAQPSNTYVKHSNYGGEKLLLFRSTKMPEVSQYNYLIASENCIGLGV